MRMGCKQLSWFFVVLWIALGVVLDQAVRAIFFRTPAVINQTVVSSEVSGSAPVFIETTRVHAENWAQTFEGIGDLKAQEDTAITTETAGVIESILFQEGDWVRKGQKLITLQSNAQKSDWDAKEAEVKLATLKVDRTRQLLIKGSVPKQNLDEQLADLAVKKAAAFAAQVRWEQTQIHAPFEGRLDLKKVSVGDYVTPGNPLVRILDTQHLKVSYQLPEEWAGRIQKGDHLKIRTLNVQGSQEAQTEVSFVGSDVDLGARTLLVQAQLSNAKGQWVSGMSVQVIQSFGAAPLALWIPEETVLADEGGYHVFAVVSGKAVLKPIHLGQRRAGQVIVVSGLTEGDTVITAGQEKLQGGESVLVR